MKRFFVYIIALAFLGSLNGIGALTAAVPQKSKQQKEQPALQKPVDPDQRRATLLSDEVRHQLLGLPYYGVFDWLSGEVRPDGTVTLEGQVVRPTTKSDAENRLKSVEGVTRVVNNIEVLPVSFNDDQIRRATYRAIYGQNSPLFEYALRAVPPIHILVKNGNVTLKGVVLNEMDRQLAETAARGVENTFDVKNELSVERKVSN